MEEINTFILNLIGNNKIDEAIEYLHELLKSSPKLDELIIQSSRYNEVSKQIRLGLISYEDSNIAKNKIRFGLIDLVREIEEFSNQSEEIQDNIKEFQRKTNSKIIQNHSGSGDNVGGNKIINN